MMICSTAEWSPASACGSSLSQSLITPRVRSSPAARTRPCNMGIERGMPSRRVKVKRTMVVVSPEAMIALMTRMAS